MASNPNRTQIICITPVRNEAWILGRFLSAAELWADQIILADQGSTDATRDIAASFSKVRLIQNPTASYDEGQRQRLLLDAAREVEGRRFVIALDADEILTPTWRESAQWQSALAAPPGTVFSFDWVNLLPGARRAYVPETRVPFAFIDDRSDHAGHPIHSMRIPIADPSLIQDIDEVKVMHLQFTDWRRMKSKQRWYQCWERLNYVHKRPIQIYRQYHRMDAFPPEEIHPVDPVWLERYQDWNIDLAPGESPEPLWWDQEVLSWIVEHGPERFRKLDIWDVPWPELARDLEHHLAATSVSDPRRWIDYRIHQWLARTQDRADSARTRWMQRMLVLLGW